MRGSAAVAVVVMGKAPGGDRPGSLRGRDVAEDGGADEAVAAGGAGRALPLAVARRREATLAGSGVRLTPVRQGPLSEDAVVW